MKKMTFVLLFLWATQLYAQESSNTTVKLISYIVPIKYDSVMKFEYTNRVYGFDTYNDLVSSWYKNKIGSADYTLFLTIFTMQQLREKLKYMTPLLRSLGECQNLKKCYQKK